MSFTLTSAVNAVRYGREQINPLHVSDKGALLADIALIVGVVAGGSLILTGIIPAPFATAIGWGAIGLGGGLILANTAAAFIRKLAHRSPKSIDYKAYIKALANTNPPSEEQIFWSKEKSPCDEIFKHLYLGNSQSFAQTTGLACMTTEGAQPVRLDTGNPLQFDTVISVCPLHAIEGDYTDWVGKDEADYANSFETNNINWMLVGRGLADSEDAFFELAHDCTLPDSDLAQVVLKPGVDSDEFQQACEDKKTAIKEMLVSEWFEPVFTELDQAMSGEKKVLVHCQAGQSRSATLLAAYLINRYGVTAEEAVAFLKRRRFCVKSKFIDALKTYENDLKQKQDGMEL